MEEYFQYDREQACKWLEVEFNVLPKPKGWKWKKKAMAAKPKDKEDGKIEVDGEILEWIIANTGLTPQAIHFLEDERKIKKEIYEELNIRSLDNAEDTVQKLLARFGAKRLLENHIISQRRMQTER